MVFSCPSSQFCAHASRWGWGWGWGRYVLESGPGPRPQHVGCRDPAFTSRPRGFEHCHRTSPPPAGEPQPQPQGVVRSPRKRLALFSEPTPCNSTGVTATASWKPRPPPGRASPDPFGADLPKAMPYWFCTNRVHPRVLCLPGVVFLFSPSEQTGLKSHPLIRRTQVAVTFISSERLICVGA